MNHCYFDAQSEVYENQHKNEYGLALLHYWIDPSYSITTKEEWKRQYKTSNQELYKQIKSQEKKQNQQLTLDYQANIHFVFNSLFVRYQHVLPGWIREYQFERILGIGKHGITLLMRSKLVPKEILAFKLVSFMKKKQQNNNPKKKEKMIQKRFEHEYWMSQQFSKIHIGLTTLFMHVYDGEKMGLMIQKVGRVTLREFLLCIMKNFDPHENKEEYKICIGHIMKQLILILDKMHEYQVTHGDFHLFNILVEDFSLHQIQNPILKLIDFDLSSTRFYFPFLDIYQLMRTLTLEKRIVENQKPRDPKLVACYEAFHMDMQNMLLRWIRNHYAASTYEFPVVQSILKEKIWYKTSYLKELTTIYRERTHLDEKTPSKSKSKSSSESNSDVQPHIVMPPSPYPASP
jgi:tRNA A-37 threonylcarbamoyl transferase component Bud32